MRPCGPGVCLWASRAPIRYGPPIAMKLEQQLADLARFGLTLEPGTTVDDLLYSFDRSQYEDKPFDLLLFMFGAEVERAPWGRPFCRRGQCPAISHRHAISPYSASASQRSGLLRRAALVSALR